MTKTEAIWQVGRICLAYPTPPPSPETMALYVEFLEPLDHRAVVAAVNELIAADLNYLPHIGKIKAAASAHYVRMREQQQQHRQLDGPALTEEERQVMKARVRDLLNTLVKKVA